MSRHSWKVKCVAFNVYIRKQETPYISLTFELKKLKKKGTKSKQKETEKYINDTENRKPEKSKPEKNKT